MQGLIAGWLASVRMGSYSPHPTSFKSIAVNARVGSATTILFIFLSVGFCFRAKSVVGQEPASAVSKRLEIYPLDVVVNAQGIAFVVDRNLPGVWKWENGELTKLFEGSPKFRTPLNAARCLALDTEGGLLVGDTSTRDIYRISAEGKAEPITGGQIGIPMDLAVAKDGTIYVADLELRKLLKIPAGSSKVEVVADVNPRGVTIDNAGTVWVISQDPNQQLLTIDSEGKVQPVVSERTFDFPHQVVVAEDGTAYVSDGYKKGIWKITPGGKPELFFSGEPLDNPVGIFLWDEELLVVDPRQKTVYKLDQDGKPSPWIELAR